MKEQQSEEYSEVIESLEQWIGYHEDPDKPIIIGYTTDGSLISPRQLVEEVKSQSEPGLQFIESLYSLADAVPELGMSGVLNMFRQPPVPKKDRKPFQLDLYK